jgi:hypothetical protein
VTHLLVDSRSSPKARLSHSGLPSSMVRMTISLIELPRPLRKGITRRLPIGHIKDQTGRKFGSKTIVGFAGFQGAFAAWLCRCKCGRLSVIRGAFLHRYHKDCHCRQQVSRSAKRVHKIYRSIISRCYDRTSPSYPYYGALGIRVCNRWRDSVEAFAADIRPRPSNKHVVARRNRRGNYTPSNCHWILRADAAKDSWHVFTFTFFYLLSSPFLTLYGTSRRSNE